jgi:DNA-binding CsgD family transcriptional regulator
MSEREQQVADLVARGLSNAEVAARLFISPRTVTTHLERIYRRLGISSRAELSRYVAADAPPGLRRATDTGPLHTRTD